MKPGTSILLVEDNEDDVFFVKRALRSSGIESPLEVASDGQAAIDFLRKAAERAALPDGLKPCLILLDLNLPFRSGLEVLRWIRQHPTWKTLIVIILTSSTSESDMSQAYTLGVNSYVIKPADATRLTELAHFLKGYWWEWNELPPICRSVTSHLGA